MSIQTQIKNLPDIPGIYLMKNSQGKVLYIGKATSLKKRVASYWRKFGRLDDVAGRRHDVVSSTQQTERFFDPRLEKLISEVKKIDYQTTDSVLEALILEANLIKHIQPKYNIKLKDDKSFVNIAVSQEEFPRIFVIRLNAKRLYKKIKIAELFGPYPSAKTARIALKILCKIFPFRGLEKTRQAERFYKEIIEIPEKKKEYKKIIRNAILFLQGKKKHLIKNLEKEMNKLSNEQRFEEAKLIRDQVFALRHLQDVALISEIQEEELFFKKPKPKPVNFNRIEAYDISNISGKNAAGSMVVFTNGLIDKNEYRHFRIKEIRGISDTAMLEEVLRRRFRHSQWKFPDLIVIDGGKGQLSVAKKVLWEYNLNVPIITIAKGQNRKGEKLFFSGKIFPVDKKLIRQLRDEAHRFAISYHRRLREKRFI